MTRYALHVGLLDREPDTLREAVEAIGPMPFAHNLETFVEGDSFREWGEPYEPDETALKGDAWHGIVAYDADTDNDAVIGGVLIFRELLAYPDSPVLLTASCTAPQLAPFAISSMEVWSAQLGVDGTRLHPSEWETIDG